MTGTGFVTRGGQTLGFTRLGFGGASIGNMHRGQTDAETRPIVDAAWDAGQRYFDTAPLYGVGLSERRLGDALRDRSREQYVLGTKVGRLLVPGEWDGGGVYTDLPPLKYLYDYSYDGVMRSFEESRQRLKLDRIDVLYVHDIDGRNHGGPAGREARIRDLIDQGGWRALDALRSAGTVKAIGCGVNEWEPCARLLELADPDIFLLAGRYTLLEQEPLNALFPQCLKRGARVVIGGPLNAGALMGGPYYDYAPITAPIRARVAALADICAAHGVPMAAAALQFAAAHPAVVSVISGAASVAEVLANAAALETPIAASFWAALKSERAINLEAPTPGDPAC